MSEKNENSSVITLFDKGMSLLKAGQKKEATEILSECWEQEKTIENATALINCLRDEGRAEDVWRVLYESSELFPESDEIKNHHVWILYDFELHPAKAQKKYQRIIEVAQKILDLSPDELLFKICIFAATDAAKALNQPEKILELLSLLDKNSLEKCTREYNGRKIMSWRERWYFACVNALFESANFEECIQICNEAFSDFPGKIEFRRKAALCLAEEDKLEEAIDELNSLIKNRSVPWYMNSDLAKLLFENGQIKDAWKNASIAAMARGELKTKVNLFQLMARILLAEGQRDGAAAHACLAAQVRKEQNWSIPESLSDMLSRLNANAGLNDSKELLRVCRDYWNKSSTSAGNSFKQPKPSENERFPGTIMMKNPLSPFAFIKSGSFKENIYVKASDIPDNLKFDGAQVTFKTVSSYDAKKNKQSRRATDLMSK